MSVTFHIERIHVGWLQRWKAAAKSLKLEVHALFLAVKHPETPWYAKVVAVCVAAYALSPIDLIPDPIPIIGYLDDLLLVLAGIALARWMIPAAVLAECRQQAAESSENSNSIGRVGALVIIVIWVAALAATAYFTVRWIKRRH
ncbi:MAG TPA: DUF1232 domain-containing protein [Tepidisphaeraceae bacterium]|nr:DUF1232 domain-containing protein [Tepidisphaeraceae bacterium]